ncbi:MAG: hypothetical protein GY937_27485 [bacterium]|nr:hypothetical protein [bacterium]
MGIRAALAHLLQLSDTEGLLEEMMSESKPAVRSRTRLAALFALTLLLGAADCDSSSDSARRRADTPLTTTQAVLVTEEMLIEEPGPGPAPAVPEPGAALVFGVGALISLRMLRCRSIR